MKIYKERGVFTYQGEDAYYKRIGNRVTWWLKDGTGNVADWEDFILHTMRGVKTVDNYDTIISVYSKILGEFEIYKQ